MKIFKSQSNTIKCGRCNTEFDLEKNEKHCPLCGFGKKQIMDREIQLVPIEKYPKEETITIPIELTTENSNGVISIPTPMDLELGNVYSNKETSVWGSWLMFNTFLPIKFLARITAWEMSEENTIRLDNLINNAIKLVHKYNLSKLKGFPNLEKDPEGNRLVYHFLSTGIKMGLFDVKSSRKDIDDVLKGKWREIEVSLTKEGLDFARLRNPVFDDKKQGPALSKEEKEWIVKYLKKIDKEGHKEYSILKDVYEFLNSGHNGNKDLWGWFEENKVFRDYIKKRSIRAKSDKKIFEQQLKNYARTFASAKISLLRELGVVKDKRNDYTIVGELR